MTRKASLLEAPYDKNGLQHWATTDARWVPNDPFCATLHLEGHKRARTAAYFLWRDENDRAYPMFMTDMFNLVNDAVVVTGTVTGQWIVCRRGRNYGIRLDGEYRTAVRDCIKTRFSSALRHLAPGHPATRIWGRTADATADVASGGNAWAADPDDIADLLINVLKGGKCL